MDTVKVLVFVGAVAVLSVGAVAAFSTGYRRLVMSGKWNNGT